MNTRAVVAWVGIFLGAACGITIDLFFVLGQWGLNTTIDAVTNTGPALWTYVCLAPFLCIIPIGIAVPTGFTFRKVYDLMTGQ